MTGYDVGTGFPIFYHHGTPNLGAPPEPLFADGIRWIGYDRPGYGDSHRCGETRRPVAAQTALKERSSAGIRIHSSG